MFACFKLNILMMACECVDKDNYIDVDHSGGVVY